MSELPKEIELPMLTKEEETKKMIDFVKLKARIFKRKLLKIMKKKAKENNDIQAESKETYKFEFKKYKPKLRLKKLFAGKCFISKTKHQAIEWVNCFEPKVNFALQRLQKAKLYILDQIKKTSLVYESKIFLMKSKDMCKHLNILY